MRPRLAIGPANYAGQAHAWTRAVRRHLLADADAFTVGRLRRGGFAFDADWTLPAPLFYLPGRQEARAHRLLRGYSHVILDGFRPVYYDRRPDAVTRQASALLAAGTRLGLLAHGTDVRDPDAHLARLPHSYHRDLPARTLEDLRARAARNRETAATLGVPTFVSTPDLLRDLPGATWLPVCVDPDRWAGGPPPLERRRPRVLFCPSQSGLKGTRYIDPVLTGLHDRGVIEYVAPRGVRHAEMERLVRDADVVVDQVQSGYYGVAAVEALAAGRVVIGSVTGLEDVVADPPPILDASPATFAAVLGRVLDDRAALAASAQGRVDYASRWHDGRTSAARLASFLGLPDTLGR